MSRIFAALGIVVAVGGCRWPENSSAELQLANLGSIDLAHGRIDSTSGLRFYDARELKIEGRAWTDDQQPYARIPTRAKALVTEGVWTASRHAAGLCIHFVTDSATVAARWDGGGAMPHMPTTGVSGVDLYSFRHGNWEFVANGRPQTTVTTATLSTSLPPAATEYILYLPLYHEVTQIAVGIAADARIAKPEVLPVCGGAAPGLLAMPNPTLSRLQRRRHQEPVVFYGTSITQGGCASRPGMAYPSILGRWLDRDVLNLGFSGAGKMELPMADLLGEIDAAVYVLDCLPNMTPEMVTERVGPFVRRLRELRSSVPIMLMEHPIRPDTQPDNIALRNVFAGLQAEGITGLTLLPGADLLKGRENATVDGVHPTDLGFLRIAEACEGPLRRILRGR